MLRMIAAIAAIMFLGIGNAHAAPPCATESEGCIVNGKMGEKFCVNGHWTRCIVQNDGQTTTGLDARCSDRTKTGQFDCVIEQPNVTQHETEYPKIVFAPGDIVEVNADGCVQTGGWGSTWKRYVNPGGPNSDRLYHGLVRIPTATANSALVRINSVVGRYLVVTGQGVPEANLVLHLGYEDDDYSDNGYYSHDDGTDDQCKTDPSKGLDGNPAYVTITIFRGVVPGNPQSRFDFDVVASVGDPKKAEDPNGLLFNPLWSWQARPENANHMPETSSCHNFAVRDTTLGIPDAFLSPSFADCTDQPDVTSVDLRPDLLCKIGQYIYGADSFGGHVNWFPVTVEGQMGWGDHSGWYAQIFGDDDYTFGFDVQDPTSGQQICNLGVNGRCNLHVEFDSDETIDHFTTDEWKAFHQAVDDGNSDLAKKYFDGHAILTGMFGLDAEHKMKSELHPLYAMAVRRDNFENGADDEAWLMFARNMGDEGFCSSHVWDAGFEDYTVRLPWRAGFRNVEVDWTKTQFDGTEGTSPPMVRVVEPPAEGNGVYVTFHLGPAALFPFVNGTLHLVWSSPLPAPPVVGDGGRVVREVGVVRRPPTPDEDEEDDETERKLSTAIHQLGETKGLEVAKARASIAGHQPVVHRLPAGSPVTKISAPPEVLRIARPRHAINGGQAKSKLTRDAAVIHALCQASNNAPAGFPASVCASVVRDHR
jgi:hypothetical protein